MNNSKNIKKLFVIVGILFATSAVIAQHPTCDGNRYKNLAFGQIDSTIGVRFGHNYTINNVSTDLYMDIYGPKGDIASKRPLIIFIHSGGFYQGTRQEGIGICSYFAYKGFLAATIDYRLIDIPLSTIDSLDVATGLVHAISDAKAAIRYFIEDAANANNFNVDTNYIFVVGASAGGVTASNLGYLNPADNIPAYFLDIVNSNGGFSGNSSSNTGHEISIKGVVNYSGALWRANWINANEPPLFSVHETGDSIVNCNYGPSAAFNNPIYFYGSCAMHSQANDQGVYNNSYFINSSGHGNYFASQIDADVVLQKTSDFLYNIICTNITGTEADSNPETGIHLYPNPSKGIVNVETPEIIEDVIRVVDLTGRVIFEFQIQGHNHQLDFSNLPNGFYLLKLKDQPSSTVKLIKE
jgi:para-nitrobenzyl esterase